MNKAWRPENRFDSTLLFVLLVVAVLRVAYLIAVPIEKGAFRVSDDAYYYYQVARNIVEGHGSTFDQIGQTNGYHPLWMVVLLPVFWLFKDPVIALRVVGILGTVIAAVALWTAYAIVAKALSRVAALAALGLFFFPFEMNHMLNGLETGLLILLLFILVHQCMTRNLLEPEGTGRKAALLGLLLGLVFLTRLDSVFIIVSVFVVWGVNLWRGCAGPGRIVRVLRPMAIAAAIVALMAIPYFAWNLITFGHLTPISGALKMSLPNVAFSIDKLTSWHWLFYDLAILASTILILIAIAKPIGPISQFLIGSPGGIGILVALWAGNLAHFVFSALFMEWAVYWWHFADLTPLTLLCFAVGFEWLRKKPRLTWSMAAIGVPLVWTMAIALWIVQDIDLKTHHAPRFEAAEWLKNNTPEDAVVAMLDAGLIGYFSERRVINLDGVINSYEFQDYVANGSLSDYLQDAGVTYFAAYNVPEDDSPFFVTLIPARFHKQPGGAIVAGYGPAVFRSEPYSDHYLLSKGRPKIQFVIWHISDVRVFDSLDTLPTLR